VTWKVSVERVVPVSAAKVSARVPSGWLSAVGMSITLLVPKRPTCTGAAAAPPPAATAQAATATPRAIGQRCNRRPVRINLSLCATTIAVAARAQWSNTIERSFAGPVVALPHRRRRGLPCRAPPGYEGGMTEGDRADRRKGSAGDRARVGAVAGNGRVRR